MEGWAEFEQVTRQVREEKKRVKTERVNGRMRTIIRTLPSTHQPWSLEHVAYTCIWSA